MHTKPSQHKSPSHQKSWHFDRRTFLRGTAGVSLALPSLQCMADSKPQQDKPARFLGVFFANGVSLPPEKHEDHEKWHWFPIGEGKDYRFTQTLQPLEPLRDHLTVLGGLSHPLGRRLVGHATGDIFLTGGDVRGSKYQNSISLDQVYAAQASQHTRVPSLVLSSNGGVGYKTRTSTISFNRQGEAIPTECMPRQIFNRLFGQSKGASQETQKKRLQQERLLVDLVLDDANSMRRNLGVHDRRKLDEYLNSVDEIERRIDRTEQWLGTPVPNIDPLSLNLEAKQDGPEDYIRTMYDLIFLAFQTDITRSASFLISQEDGKGVSDKFPAIALGLSGHHSLSHGTGKDQGYEQWARYDQFLAKQHAYFLQRLHDATDGEETLLDRTVSIYGSATSTTHNARNYPLVLSGGDKLGLKHGHYRRYNESTPLSNMHLTVLQQLGVPLDSFADSTGTMAELV